MKQRELITQLFNLMTGLLCEKIEKITLINGYEKIRHIKLLNYLIPHQSKTTTRSGRIE
jgi:hypothetical protein